MLGLNDTRTRLFGETHDNKLHRAPLKQISIHVTNLPVEPDTFLPPQPALVKLIRM